MDILVTYDVNTEDNKGRRRLRRVAKLCTGFGQRVQLSVFECTVNDEQYEMLRAKLVNEIDAEQDSLRIYRLMGGREGCVESFGIDTYRDFSEPMIV